MSELFEWFKGNPLFLGGGIGVVATLLGIIWMLHKRKSPGLKVADEFIKDQIKEDKDEAERKKQAADDLIDGTAGSSSSNVSEREAVDVITGAIADGKRGRSS